MLSFSEMEFSGVEGGTEEKGSSSFLRVCSRERARASVFLSFFLLPPVKTKHESTNPELFCCLFLCIMLRLVGAPPSANRKDRVSNAPNSISASRSAPYEQPYDGLTCSSLGPWPQPLVLLSEYLESPERSSSSVWSTMLEESKVLFFFAHVYLVHALN